MIINYDCTVTMLVNYGHKTFIVRATGCVAPTFHDGNVSKAQLSTFYLFQCLPMMRKEKVARDKC